MDILQRMLMKGLDVAFAVSLLRKSHQRVCLTLLRITVRAGVVYLASTRSIT
jgi:hypothetical protein